MDTNTALKASTIAELMALSPDDKRKVASWLRTEALKEEPARSIVESVSDPA